MWMERYQIPKERLHGSAAGHARVVASTGYRPPASGTEKPLPGQIGDTGIWGIGGIRRAKFPTQVDRELELSARAAKPPSGVLLQRGAALGAIHAWRSNIPLVAV